MEISIFLLYGCLALTLVVHGQDQSGFMSIDCGIPEDSSYTDVTTGIFYTSDTAYIDTGVGVNKNISSEFMPSSLQQQLTSVRSFPDGPKNCYRLTLTQGKDNNYLIRAWFMYRNYDSQLRLPEFDLYLGVNLWTTVEFINASHIRAEEIIHVPSTDYVEICLVNRGSGTPFISALELRLINSSIYKPQFGSLVLYTRMDVGAENNQATRYKDDVYDRIWQPYNWPYWSPISARYNTGFLSDNEYKPPQTVMATAVTPLMNPDNGLQFTWRIDDPNSRFYIYLHFAEVTEPKGFLREFSVLVNGASWSNAFVPHYLHPTTIYSNFSVSGTELTVTISKTAKSTLQPILNALEIYQELQLLQSPTDQQDVNAIKNIKSVYGVKKNWQGDPCTPKSYLWEGLSCSNDGHNSPKIISVNLSLSGLTGDIPPSLSNLTYLESLDLSNYSLTGPVPDFLTGLRFLRILNLTGNKLTGTVPVVLIEKSNNASLSLSIGDNPNLCISGQCRKKKTKVAIPVIATVTTCMVLLIALAIWWWILKRRKQQGVRSLESKNKKFTYSEVVGMTNNFERAIGRGGFGTVYHGTLEDGTQVAVKMLSPSATQGYEQFQTEMTLFLRIHHRNLVSLVGYCHEGTSMGLIYEFMANGNLQEHLSAANRNALSWEERILIAVDAAQGLEYLHNGCRPPIIHRDVKASNILLNERLQAKIGDFGLSRIIPTESVTHVLTEVAGTFGYLDPEYHVTSKLNEKSDVYSFGIVLLELITGQPVRSHENIHITQWIRPMLSRGDIQNIVDPRLRGDINTNFVWKALEIAMTCVPPKSIQRPTMNHVLMELKECLAQYMIANTASLSRPIELNLAVLGTEMDPQAR